MSQSPLYMCFLVHDDVCMKNVKVYVAGGFFTPEQLATLEKIEAVIENAGCDVFRPRNARSAAKKLNKDIGAGKDPDPNTRRQVFQDNIDNIEDAQLVVAIVDGRDVGTIWEMGFAYACRVPIITYTEHGFGVNLLLAESSLALCKGVEQLAEAMSMFVAGHTMGRIVNNDLDAELTFAFDAKFKRANLAETSASDKNMTLYKKGE
jgi:nucleoside 2-deoxyribosyltransferase